MWYYFCLYKEEIETNVFLIPWFLTLLIMIPILSNVYSVYYVLPLSISVSNIRFKFNIKRLDKLSVTLYNSKFDVFPNCKSLLWIFKMYPYKKFHIKFSFESKEIHFLSIPSHTTTTNFTILLSKLIFYLDSNVVLKLG